MSDEATLRREHARFPHSVPGVLEASAQRFGADVIGVLRLRDGRFAIFNHAYELCGFVESLDAWPPICWRPWAPPKRRGVTLEDLGL